MFNFKSNFYVARIQVCRPYGRQKTAEELDDDILEGMYFCLKNMQKLQERPEALKHEVFDTIFEMGELLEMDEDTRYKIIENMTTERDLKNQLDYARKEGKAEAQLEIARKLKMSGVDNDTILNTTGLDKETIETL